MIIDSNDNNFFKSIIQALMDFNEMNPIEPLQMVLEVSNTHTHTHTHTAYISRNTSLIYLNTVFKISK